MDRCFPLPMSVVGRQAVADPVWVGPAVDTGLECSEGVVVGGNEERGALVIVEAVDLVLAGEQDDVGEVALGGRGEEGRTFGRGEGGLGGFA